MANLQRLLTRRPQIDEAEVEDVRERTMARLAALNGDVVATETSDAVTVADAPAEPIVPDARIAEPTAASAAASAPTPVESSPPKPAGPKIIVPRTISLGPPPAPTAAAEPEPHRAPPIIVLGEPTAADEVKAAEAEPAASAAAPVVEAEAVKRAPAARPKVEAPVAKPKTEAPVAHGEAILLGAPAPAAEVVEIVEAGAPVEAKPATAKAKPATAKAKSAPTSTVVSKATQAAAAAKPAPATASKAKAAKPKTTAKHASTPKSAAPKAAKPKTTRRPPTAIPVVAEPEPVIEPQPKVVRRDPSLPVPRVAVVADEWDTQEAAAARPTAPAEPVAVVAEPVAVPVAVAEPVAAAAAAGTAGTTSVAAAAGPAIAVAERALGPESDKLEAVASAPVSTAPSQPKGRSGSSLLAKVAISRPTVKAAPVAAVPVAVAKAPVASKPPIALETPPAQSDEPVAIRPVIAEAPGVVRAPDVAEPATAEAPVVTAPVRAAPAPAKTRPAPKPPAKAVVARQPVHAAAVAAVAAAFCPYCALALEPPPTASRRCTRCKQRIVVKRVQGRVVYLTEAAVEVFESERLRSANFGRWAKERTQWLRLAKSVRADAGRIERLGAAPLSDKVVESAKTLYLSTAERQYRDAKREDRWEDASRLKREQAAALHRVAGSPATPTAEVLALHREAVSTELRGIGKMAKEAALVGNDCCDACRADDGRTFKIAAELRTPRLPHEGCPKGLCYCRWDLTIRDRTMVERYLRRTVRPPKAKRPTA